MVRYWRKLKQEGKTASWEKVRKRFWEPVLNAMLIITLGFGIFLFSQFPPTQRFGGIIVFGALLSAFTALYLMPWLICNLFSRKTCEV